MLALTLGLALAGNPLSPSPQVGRDVLVQELEKADFEVADSRGVFVGVRRFLEPDGRPSDEIASVPFAVDDAVDLAYLFVYDLILMEPDGVVLLLSGEPAKAESAERLERLRDEGAKVETPSRANILDNLKYARTESGPNGLFVLQVASHGFSDGGLDMLLGSDAVLSDLRRTSLQVGSLLDQVAQSTPKRRIVIIDACRERVSQSRALGDEGKVMRQSFAQALGQAQGMVVLSGTVAGGYSFDDAELGNGVFTAKLIQGIQGAAPGDRNGFITLETLALWADAQVREWVQVHRAGYAGLSGGITYNVEDLRSASLPLAVNQADFRSAGELGARVRDAADHLLGVVDFTTMRGDHAQEVFDALQRAEKDEAERLFKRIGYLTANDPHSTERFVQWWIEEGRQPFGIEPSASGMVRGFGVVPASHTVPYGLSQVVDADEEPNGSLAEATRAAMSSSFAGEVGGSGDAQDRYHFRPEENGLFTIKVQNLEKVGTQNAGLGFAALEDAQANAMGSIHPGGLTAGLEGALGPIALSANHSYYVIAQPANAKNKARYRIETSYTPLSQPVGHEPNDALAKAHLIEIGSEVAGQVGFGEDDEDWYRFRPSAHGVGVLQVSNEYADVNVRLGGLGFALVKGTLGQDLASIHPGGLGASKSGKTQPFPVYADVNHYVVVESGQGLMAAPYSASVIVQPLPFGDSLEPNDSRGQSAFLEVNQTVQALIGYGGDLTDWYRFVPEVDGELRITVSNQHVDPSTLNGQMGMVAVHSKAGDHLGGIHAGGLGPSRTTSSPAIRVEGGSEYFVEVKRADNALGGAPYILEIGP